MTGVPASTLRTWQRRYGVPQPQRTESSYRLFGDHDVAQIIRLRDLVRGGLSASEAARQVLADTRPPDDAEVSPPDDPFARVRDQVFEALRRYDLSRVEFHIRQAVTMAPGTAVFSRVFMPLLHEVGDRWEAGELTVTQEHLISEMLTGFTREMLRVVQPPSSAKSVLLACFADEQHILPLYAAAFQFAQWGYQAVMLGARTPPDALGFAVTSFLPALVGLSVTVAPTGQRAEELVRGYAASVGTTPWLAGGAGAASLAPQLEQAGCVVVPTGSTAIADALRKMGM